MTASAAAAAPRPGAAVPLCRIAVRRRRRAARLPRFASIICRDTADLYRYVTERLGALDGITGLEVTPSPRVLEQAQTMLDADRITLVR
ncbi:hypothetical protein [Nocardia abscessus]|uniref:hypothetical protein n=1 Tax=Nocardia abscessus TaxID=120957 RepID=UPI0003093F22|nr:hypothetical protein [Nocardia abscessus]MCC3329980.1 hypothetical protein [Nocardia abscessus]